MPSGLLALLDDVAAIAKLAASSVDDIAGAAGKASAKAAGVVIDDTAVTPGYVVGLTPERELPIIGKIAKGSLRNKLLFILPGALLLSAFAPWALTPILMIGGSYLCFEGAEKIIEMVTGHGHGDDGAEQAASAEELEAQSVSGAVRTDFILSAEIMAIALAELADQHLIQQAMALLVVAILITAGVYGAVGLIVKLDDIGLKLAKRADAGSRALGAGLVHAMPIIIGILGPLGTVAMLWVGGGIFVHGLEEFHLGALPHAIHAAAEGAGHALAFAAGAAEWLVSAVLSALFGLVWGGVIVAVVMGVKRVLRKR